MYGQIPTCSGAWGTGASVLGIRIHTETWLESSNANNILRTNEETAGEAGQRVVLVSVQSSLGVLGCKALGGGIALKAGQLSHSTKFQNAVGSGRA